MLSAPAAIAVDGVIEINQVTVEAGGVTPGDTPGFPVTIGLPGSYRLTGDLVNPDPDPPAVEVLADDVSLDLNGYTIRGSGTSSGNGSGVDADSAENVTVRNGTVRGMPEAGVTVGENGQVVDVRSLENGTGISADSGCLVRDSIAAGNRANGIETGLACTVTGNISRLNGGYGIITARAATVQGNTTYNNGEGGILVILGSTVTGNTSFGNVTFGIGTSTGCTVTNNTVNQNGGWGLVLAPDSGYGGNTIRGNTAGTVSSGKEIGLNLCDGSTTCP